MKRSFILISLCLSVILTTCKDSPPTLAPPTASPVSTPPSPTELVTTPAYPAPSESQVPEAYPIPSNENGYPAPSNLTLPVKNGPPFYIDEPVVAGTMELRGSGPADVPIRAIDVTTLGTELGSGIIDKDGNFIIQLGTPLQAGHSVGLKIGSLEGTPFSYDDFLFGETYYDRPYVGVLLAMAPVVEE